MKKVISFILCLILSILLIVSLVLIVATNTILNQDFIILELESNDYYTLIDTNIKSEIEAYTKQSGLDDEVFENIYSKEHLVEDINSIIISVYNGKESALNESILEDNLRNSINKYLNKNEISLTPSEQIKIDDFVKKIVDIYVKEVSHPVYLDTVSNVILNTNKIVRVIYKAVYIAVLIIAMLIVLINIKNIRDAFIYFAISMLTSAFFNILVFLLFIFRFNINHFLILNSAFTLLVVSIMNSTIKHILFIDLILLIIVIFILDLINIRKFKKTIAKNT